jgi:hypothetical protein
MDGSTLAPTFMAPAAVYPTLPNLNLTEEEAGTATWLAQRLFQVRQPLELRGLYYDGMQKMQDLGISIPPQLTGLRTVVGWPAIGIDALVNRTIVEGFRYPGQTDVDDELMSIWQANDLDTEAPLAHLDALNHGRAYAVIGPADEDSLTGEPLITYESALNMIAVYDARLRRVTAALQMYVDMSFTSETYGHEVAALYLPGKTIHMARSQSGGPSRQWEITTDPDDTEQLGGRLPVVRLANRQRLSNRDGQSEIRASWMNTVDSACRTLLGLEVGREFHIAPRKYALGVQESAFVDANGNAKTAWETYLNKVWMREADDEGNVPTVGQFPGQDPSGYTKILETYADIMCGEMGLPGSMLGRHADGNPASADAIRAGYEELTSRARMKQVAFAGGHEETMQIALMVKHGRDALPENAHRIETDWRNPAPETPAGTTDAIAKQVAAGIIPPRSDVTLKRLSYSPVERARLADDWTDEQGRTALQDIHDMLKQRAQGGAPAEHAQPAGPSPADMPKKVPVRGDGEPR